MRDSSVTRNTLVESWVQGQSTAKSCLPSSIISQLRASSSAGSTSLRDSARQFSTGKERQLDNKPILKVPHSSSCREIAPGLGSARSGANVRSKSYRTLHSASCEDCTRARRRNVPIRKFPIGLDAEDGYDYETQGDYSQGYRRQKFSFYHSDSDSDSEETTYGWASDDRRKKILQMWM